MNYKHLTNENLTKEAALVLINIYHYSLEKTSNPPKKLILNKNYPPISQILFFIFHKKLTIK